jgi:hypothetical protein
VLRSWSFLKPGWWCNAFIFGVLPRGVLLLCCFCVLCVSLCSQESESEGRPDTELAAEAWANYRRRNDSHIVDHFQVRLQDLQDDLAGRY